jgi:hypothetical protein
MNKHDPRIETEFPDWKKVEPTLHVSSRMLTVADNWEKYAKEANLGPPRRNGS